MGQLALACAEGGMEWLYPVGVLRLTLGSSDSARGFASPACGRRGPLLESRSSLRGRAASWSCCWLRTRAQPGVDACAGVPRERRALFLQATPHLDLSRRVASFRFELQEDGRPELPPKAHGLGTDGE